MLRGRVQTGSKIQQFHSSVRMLKILTKISKNVPSNVVCGDRALEVACCSSLGGWIGKIRQVHSMEWHPAVGMHDGESTKQGTGNATLPFQM